MENLAVFDFDGTITRHDSFPRFILHVYKKNRFSLLVKILLFLIPIILTKLNIASTDKIKERLYISLFNRLTIDDLRRKCKSFIPSINRDLSPLITERIKHHQRLGHKIIIISASLRELIQPWADSHGITHIIATEIKRDNENHLCGFASPNCNGPEKVRRLKEFLGPDTERYHITGYGNSSNDYPLLKFCQNSYIHKHKILSDRYEIIPLK